ncbi:c-type cytochrome [Thioflavicoccus mobilis]|nr:c-type cytochrome [Thioflavicoccus mobilis]
MKIRLMMAAVVVALVGAPVQAADMAAGEAKANQVCMACHGPQGNSVVPIWPKLAGQQPDYIYKQLTDFKSGARVNEQMSPMAAPLTEDDMHNVAVYYAAQTQTAGTTDPEQAELGKQIFMAGNADTGVPACSGCHGAEGLGLNLAKFPRLAGQHADYLANTLKAFRASERANDPNAMMQGTAARLTDDEITAVAQYLQGLGQ